MMTTNCQRCHGLMVLEETHDLLTQGQSLWVQRCLNCGRLSDALIEYNRLHLPVRVGLGKSTARTLPPLTMKGVH